MEKIAVNLGKRSYNIHVGAGILASFDFSQFNASKFIIVTDSIVKKIAGNALVAQLNKNGFAIDVIEIPAGENSKTWEVAGKIGREIATKGGDKDTILLGLGGGVVGDITGFAASVFGRGIRYIHIPTTLLAQVDSSIGGKTGVNIPEGKNLLGSTHQPVAVISDIDFLKALPEAEIQNGLAEIIKYAVMQDVDLFEYLEKNILERSEAFYTHLVTTCVRLKAGVVENDEYESEQRKIFNYGHTVGHAVEILSHHQIPHGQAIAIGMNYEATIAVKIGIFDQGSLERQNALIKKAGLPLVYKFDVEKAVEIMRKDKKAKNGGLYFVLPKKIGEVFEKEGKISFDRDETIVRDTLSF